MSDKTFDRAFASVRVWYNKRYQRFYYTARIAVEDGCHLRTGYPHAIPNDGEQHEHLFRGVLSMIAEAGYHVPDINASWYSLYEQGTYVLMDVVSVPRKRDLHYTGTASMA